MGVLKKRPFKIGDEVTSKFFTNEADIVRKITSCFKDVECGSDWRAAADGGKRCHCCKKVLGEPIVGIDGDGVDAAWFEKTGG